MSTIPSPRFYVYTLARPNGSIFYVGKGSGKRTFAHDKEARSGHACHKCNIIRKIWKQGGEVQRTIVFTTDNEAEAFDYEAELIATFKPGILANVSGGGDGGSNPSAETRAKLSMIRKATWDDPEYRARLSETHKASWDDPEYRVRQSTSRKAAWDDPDRRARTSTRLKEEWDDPDRRAQQSASRKAAWDSPDRRAQQSAVQRAVWDDPEYRARLSETHKASWDDPDRRARQSAALKAAWEKRKKAK